MTELDQQSEALRVAVGAHVRALRGKRGMTRRELSESSGVSERYLSELENGRANASLSVLNRISTSLDEPFDALLTGSENGQAIISPLRELLIGLSEREQAALYRTLLRQSDRQRYTIRGIALIGLRGAGKTTLGRRLAAALTIPFISLTDVVKDLAGMDIGEMMELMGQQAYRRNEYDALSHIIERNGRAVLEAGGGLVLQAPAFNLLLKHFHTVWIKASVEEHMARVINQGDLRPMAGHAAAMDDLRALLREREPYYRQADMVIDTTERELEPCASELIMRCREALAG